MRPGKTVRPETSITSASIGNRHGGPRSDGLNALSVNQDRRILEDRPTRAVDESGSNQCFHERPPKADL